MKFKNLKFFSVLFSLCILLSGCKISSCQDIGTMAASITVRTSSGTSGFIGLNGDTDHLAFSSISPSMTSTKTSKVGYAKDALVTVIMKGEIAPWTEITPSYFTLSADEIQEVKFDVTPPGYTSDGNYTGQAVFCFKEK